MYITRTHEEMGIPWKAGLQQFLAWCIYLAKQLMACGVKDVYSISTTFVPPGTESSE